jgi:nucleosome binding factor SPN SPT16 subunit
MAYCFEVSRLVEPARDGPGAAHQNEPKLYSLLEYIGTKNNPDVSIGAIRERVYQCLNKVRPDLTPRYLEWLKSDFSVDPKTIPGGEA